MDSLVPVPFLPLDSRLTPRGILTKAPACDGRRIIKRGLRKNSFRHLQIYWCKDFGGYFVSLVGLKGVKYPPRVIARALCPVQLRIPTCTRAAEWLIKSNSQASSSRATSTASDLSDEDRKENDYSLEHGFRLLSAYRTNAGDKLWR